MIKEAFLVCALAAMPAFSGKTQTPVPAHLIHELTHLPGFIQFVQKKKTPILVVSGMAALVEHMRTRGFLAFGAHTVDGLGITRFHAVMEPEKMAFQDATFSSLYWLHPNQRGQNYLNALAQLIPLLTPEGFLIFDEYEYEFWAPYLKEMGWERLPFKEGVLTIWQKPFPVVKTKLSGIPERIQGPWEIWLKHRAVMRDILGSA